MLELSKSLCSFMKDMDTHTGPDPKPTETKGSLPGDFHGLLVRHKKGKADLHVLLLSAFSFDSAVTGHFLNIFSECCSPRISWRI